MLIPYRLVSTIAALVVVCCCSAFAQLGSADKHYVYSSSVVQATNVNLSIGPSLTMLPQPLTEYPTPAPMLDLRWRVTTPYHLNLYGRFGSNIATSIVKAGGLFSADIGSFSAGVGYSAAFVYGNITFIDGFNTSQQRWINYPTVSLSAMLDKLTLTARGELEMIMALDQRIEDQEVGTSIDKISGGSLTIVAEQPFWNTTHVLLGVSLSYSSNPYQAWFIYNTFNERLFSSELFLGFIL
ncbi:MAG: hypothetical protein FGM32_11335 [Candidatus Kapabacteria bacterium]|nr:hypothetical protein [Candidatus Kapabacteria bacterium]